MVKAEVVKYVITQAIDNIDNKEYDNALSGLRMFLSSLNKKDDISKELNTTKKTYRKRKHQENQENKEDKNKEKYDDNKKTKIENSPSKKVRFNLQKNLIYDDKKEDINIDGIPNMDDDIDENDLSALFDQEFAQDGSEDNK